MDDSKKQEIVNSSHITPAEELKDQISVKVSFSTPQTPTMKQKFILSLMIVLRIFFPSAIFAKFFVSSIIPPLADNIIPLFFTGNIPDESGLAVASQFMFISIILEVIQEGVGNSLFFYVGTHYEGNRRLSLTAFKLSLVILIGGGILLTIFMLLFTPQFVNLIDTPETIEETTRRYLYSSAFSFIPILLRTAFNNFLLITTSSWIIVSQMLTVLLTFLVNFFLFGQHSWSLQWGINELGIYKIIQSTLSMFVSFSFIFVIEKMSPFTFIFKIPFYKDIKSNFKEFFKVSWGNFGDSAVRNFFYFVVTLKFMNNLGEDDAGAWNLLNSIIWGIVLIPGFVVANYIKVRIGLNSSKPKIKAVAKESVSCLFAWIIIMTILTGTLWTTMASFFSKSNERVQILSETMLHNVGFIFIVFACNNAIDSFFFGTGRTEYVFYQSLATNFIVYFVPWVLYLMDILKPTYWWILGLYISGMLVDFCFTLFFCIRLWKSIP